MKKNLILLIFMIASFYFGIACMPINAALKNNWEYVETECYFHSITFGNKCFVGLSEGYSFVSEDGYEWEKGQYLGQNAEIYFCGEIFWAIDTSGRLFLSRNGKQWEKMQIGNFTDYSENNKIFICYNQGKYYSFINQFIYGGAGSWAGNDLHVYCSDNGKDWSYLTSFCNKLRLDQIFYAGDKLMGIGTECKHRDETADIIYLWKDEQWLKCSQMELNDRFMGQLAISEITCGDQGLIAVGNCIMWRSEDGVVWKKDSFQLEAGYNFKHIIFINHEYMAITDRGEIYTLNTNKSNAVWKKMKADLKIYQLTYGNGISLAIAGNGLYVNETGCSNNAYLAGCSFEDGEIAPSFEPEKYSYTLEIPAQLTEISAAIRPMELSAQAVWITDDGKEYSANCGEKVMLPCSDTCKQIAVKLTAENGVSHLTYTFRIVRSICYLLDATAQGSGSIGGQGYVRAGEAAMLKAMPDAGYQFTGWYENHQLYSDKETIEIADIDRDRHFEAKFEPVTNENLTIILEQENITRGNWYKIKTIDSQDVECDCDYEVLCGLRSCIWYDEWLESYFLSVDSHEIADQLVIQAALISDPSYKTTLVIPLLSVDETETNWNVESFCYPEDAGKIAEESFSKDSYNQGIQFSAIAMPGYRFSYWKREYRYSSYDEEQDCLVYEEWKYDDIPYSEDDCIEVRNEYYYDVEYRYIAVFEPQNISYLRILRKPQKLNYYVGELFQTEGMLIRAYYEDGTYVSVDEYHYPSDAFTDEGEITVPISYGEGDEKKIVNLTVVVYPKQENTDKAQEDKEKDSDNTEDGSQAEDQKAKDTNTDTDKTDNNQSEDAGDESKEEGNTDVSNEKKSDAGEPDDSDVNDKRENDSKMNDGEENGERENDERENDERENDDKENEDRENDDKENDNKENDNKENDDKEKDSKENVKKENNNKEKNEKEESQKQNEDTESKSKEDVRSQSEDTVSSGLASEKGSEAENGQSSALPDNTSDNKGNGKGQNLKKNYRFKVGKLTYQITKLKNKTGQVAVIKAEKNCKTIVIPPQIKMQGYTLQVTKIGSRAFDKQSRLEKVTIGKNVEIIEANAFFRCKKLQIIHIKTSKLKKVAKNAFIQIAKKHKVFVPKKCRKKYQSWIKKNHLTVKK